MGAGVEMDWGAIPRMVKKGHFQKGSFWSKAWRRSGSEPGGNLREENSRQRCQPIVKALKGGHAQWVREQSGSQEAGVEWLRGKWKEMRTEKWECRLGRQCQSFEDLWKILSRRVTWSAWHYTFVDYRCCSKRFGPYRHGKPSDCISIELGH